MDRPQAIQFVAVTLAPLEGEARRARAWEVGDQMDQACGALRALPPTSTSCLGVVQVQLRAARNLCESWIEWWDEIQDLPREAARPEPIGWKGCCGRRPRDLVLCLPTPHWSTLHVTIWRVTMTVSMRPIALRSVNCSIPPTTRPTRQARLSVGQRCNA